MRCEYVYADKLLLNCRKVEDVLQKLLDPLPLGLRLHRRSTAGAYTNKKQGEPGFIAKVFLAVFKVTTPIDANAIIVINEHPVQIRYTNIIRIASIASDSPSSSNYCAFA